MKINEAFDEIENFRKVLMNGRPEMGFEIEIIPKYDGPFRKWFREEVPGRNASKQSGVYLIADQNDTIIYIGKAAASNLGAEIWGKFGAPTYDENSNSPKFSKSSLAKWAKEESHRKLITEGNINIRAAIVKPREYSPLIEVYLHVWCVRNGGLPDLNNQIG